MKNTVIGFRITEQEKEAGKRKAGILPLSAAIRRLFQMWLDGKVILTLADDSESTANANSYAVRIDAESGDADEIK